uniref:Glycoside hydrolase family 5 domain-containing protein n=1 Tax=Cucumis melo TaxID=3656 RepID=A0A9I9DR56_CUCME
MQSILKQLMLSPKAGIFIKENPLYDNFDSALSKLKKEAHPDVMSVMMVDITAEAAMTEMERKINLVMKVVKEQDHKITALREQMQIHETTKSSQTPQLQDMITSSIRAQYGGPPQTSFMYSKPYTKRINDLRMPVGYQPLKFQQFDRKGNLNQHVAHFVETCKNTGSRGDQLVKQFVRSLKGNAFKWYIDLEPEAYSLPLSTNGRWIIDATTGRRVKLMCVNWAGHMQGMLVEGLHRRPLDDIAALVAKLRFNCVRLTYSIHMFTRHANVTVKQSFENFDMKDALVGIAQNNPSILNLTLVEAYGAVVDSLAAHGIMVVSDNHISQPRWCCDNDDGNGFFGDRYFDPQEWFQGISLAAQSLKSKAQVVAMSLRNEPRGPNQNVEKWFQYMSQGAKLIHQINPNALVVVSGLSYDTDLSFLRNRSMGFNLDNKLVFEAHLYSFTNNMRDFWMSKPLNTFCASINQGFEDRAGFLVRGQNPIPLFVSEFGIDQTGTNEGQNRFLSCFFSYLTENDFDWGLWALQESQRLLFYTDPSSNFTTSFIMYHPLSGGCMRMNKKYQLGISSCKTSNRWSHEQDGAPIKLAGSILCLKAIGVGLPPILSQDCSSQQSIWKYGSNAKLQLATVDEQGQALCLQRASHSHQIVTNKCLCSNDSQCQEDPQSQWFTLVPSNLRLIA